MNTGGWHVAPSRAFHYLTMHIRIVIAEPPGLRYPRLFAITPHREHDGPLVAGSH